MGKNKKESNMTLRFWGFGQREASAVIFSVTGWLPEKNEQLSFC